MMGDFWSYYNGKNQGPLRTATNSSARRGTAESRFQVLHKQPSGTILAVQRKVELSGHLEPPWRHRKRGFRRTVGQPCAVLLA